MFFLRTEPKCSYSFCNEILNEWHNGKLTTSSVRREWWSGATPTNDSTSIKNIVSVSVRVSSVREFNMFIVTRRTQHKEKTRKKRKNNN